jgi:hypothetical protein
VVAEFDRRYRERTGAKPTWNGATGAMVKRLLAARHSPEEVCRRIGVLFDAPPWFLAGSVPDIPTLVQHFDKLATPAQGTDARDRGLSFDDLMARADELERKERGV